MKGSGIEPAPGQPMNNGFIRMDAPCRVICVSCSDSRFFTAHSYAQHTSSPDHQEKLHELRMKTRDINAALPVVYRCVCSPKQFKKYEDYLQHCQTEIHVKRVRVKSLADKIKAEQAHSSWDPNGGSTDAVDIDFDQDSFNFGYVVSGKKHKKVVSLTNRGDKPVCLSNVLVMPRPGWGASFFEVEGKRSAVIPPSGSEDYRLIFAPKHIGYYEQCVIFRFDGGKEIVGRMTGSVSMNPEDLDVLKPTSRYRKRTVKDDFMLGRSVVKLHSMYIQDSNRPYSNTMTLGYYNIPEKLNKLFRMSTEDALAAIRKKIKFPFTTMSYVEAMSTMLYAEEVAMKIEIQSYDLFKVELRQTEKKRYFLLVHGLAEGRPSVIRTDKIKVLPTEGLTSETKAFEGRVLEVHRDEILVDFHPSFHKVFSETQRFDVRFSFNRQPFRRMHAAINNTAVRRFAFPKSGASVPLSDTKFAEVRANAENLKCINEQLSTNMEQKLAVSIILDQLHGSTPFILFGPPGTGKTVTLVEAILQIRRRATHQQKEMHVLVCTPSNTSADLILNMLHFAGVSEKEMIRVNSPSRSPYIMPMKKHLEKYCRYEDGFYFKYPSLEEIDRFRIVIMTNIAAGVLPLLGNPKEFTHIMIDEAGQCAEPETLVPLQLASKNTGVVLAGDHHQLGPGIRSPICNALDFQVSLIERLIRLPHQTPYPWCQSPSRSSNNFGVKLLINYRSHPELMSLSNRLFYESELQFQAPKVVTDRLLDWPGLPQAGYPLKFIGVEGLDQREGNSPSWFNIFEAEVVVKEIIDLLAYYPPNNRRILPKDIGVVVPYRKQVEKIRQLLHRKKVRDFDNIKVETVERFQGLEKAVIIVSTVRSQPKWISFDEKFNLGFLSNPKRFNVSVTRARSLMIIVGNPNVLVEDEYWAIQIREIAERGGAVGAQVMMRPVNEEESVEELARLVDALDVNETKKDKGKAKATYDDTRDEVLSNEGSWSTSAQDYLSSPASSGQDGKSDDDNAGFQLI
ncbi:hypothetical protein BGW41_007511 [Actinomortierella wolfii]|nr:hypothetical protein BGW41_007511 [Actinomortierella wolfii]